MPALRMPAMSDALRVGMVLLTGAAGMLATAGPATAEEAQSGYVDLARELAEEISAEPAGETLDAWSRTVIERALERVAREVGPASDDAVTPAPVFRGQLVTDVANHAPTADVLVFTSLAVPAASWRAAARDAARVGAPLVLRGMAAGSLPETARQITTRLGGADVGVAIDPRLFRLFGIARVPAVVVVPGGVPPCRSRGCADDAPPPFDRVSGNLSLAAALEAVASEGDVSGAVARRHLATLRGSER